MNQCCTTIYISQRLPLPEASFVIRIQSVRQKHTLFMPSPANLSCPPYRTIHRHYDLTPGVLPYPATKLAITQHINSEPNAPDFAWIVVGSFYDCEDNILWSTEVFVGRVPPGSRRHNSHTLSEDDNQPQSGE